MKRTAIGRVCAGALVALVAWGAAQLAYAGWLCPSHRAWAAVQAGDTQVVLERDERLPHPGESVFVCETPHHIGTFALHEDLDCYCAPSNMTPSGVGAAVGGRCRLDDGVSSGSCGKAFCSQYLDAQRQTPER